MEDDSYEDEWSDWDFEDDDEEEDIEMQDKEHAEFKLQNACGNIHSAIKEYTHDMCLPICEHLTPDKIYEFTQNVIGKNS